MGKAGMALPVFYFMWRFILAGEDSDVTASGRGGGVFI